MTLTRALFKPQSIRLAEAIATAADDTRQETEIDTTQFTGAYRSLASQANKMLRRIREQHAGAHQLIDSLLTRRELPARMPRQWQALACDAQALSQRISHESRLHAALDAIDARVMIADAQGTIVYVNLAMAQTLFEIGYDLEPALRGIEASTVIGCSIDLFHADPYRGQRGAQPGEPPRHTRLSVGDREFDLMITDLPGSGDTGDGTIVEWREISPTRIERIDRESQALLMN